MKKILGFVAFSLILFACKKEDKDKGVCYCEFFSEDKQEYDLTHLSRQNQQDTCNTHDSNAANFGGECELE